MQIQIDERLKVRELAEALANAGLTLKYRDGQVVLTHVPLPIANGFRAVTREEFFRTVGQENVTPVPCGRYPYYNEWRTPAGYVRGWSHAGTYAVRQEDSGNG